MLTQIQGLHHVTSMAKDARQNNAYFTQTLGLRRVKQTVNFDAPDVYHLYYGDAVGNPGSVMTYFPFPNIAAGQRGVGEVGETVFSVASDALPFWHKHLATKGVGHIGFETRFGAQRLQFDGPDGDRFALVGTDDDVRTPWPHQSIGIEAGIRGFHSVSVRLQDGGATGELLEFMGYQKAENQDHITRYILPHGNGAHIIDIETLPTTSSARQGAGSVHHIAFAVENRQAQLEVRKALIETGYAVTPVIDRDYFWAIYFRTPGGVLFEVATNEPGFDRDEEAAHLGEALKLPSQHAHLRPYLEKHLPPLE